MNESILRTLDRAEQQHGVFTTAQLRRDGVDHHVEATLVSSRRLELVGRGLLRVVGSPDTWHQRLWLGLLEAPPGSAVSHWSTAQLQGLPGDRRLDEVHVLTTVDLDHRARHARLHQTRDLPPDHVTTIDGIPCTTIARTIFDLARTESPKWIGILLDAGRHRCGMTVEEMVETTLRLAKRGRAGTRTMRHLVAERMESSYVPTESVLEAEFVALCGAYGLPEAERQILLGDDEALIGRVDFFYRPDLVVELDGRAFHGGPVAEARDADRDARLRALGIDVLRLGWHDVVRDPSATAKRVRRRLDRTRSVGGCAAESGGTAHRTGVGCGVRVRG
jgi:predicted transcriptional regulator of viral defense system